MTALKIKCNFVNTFWKERKQKMAKVICGVNELTNESFTGKSIRQLQEELKVMLNIPDNPTVLLNDEETSDLNQVVRVDDEVEFVKPAGTKG